MCWQWCLRPWFCLWVTLSQRWLKRSLHCDVLNLWLVDTIWWKLFKWIPVSWPHWCADYCDRCSCGLVCQSVVQLRPANMAQWTNILLRLEAGVEGTLNYLGRSLIPVQRGWWGSVVPFVPHIVVPTHLYLLDCATFDAAKWLSPLVVVAVVSLVVCSVDRPISQEQ